MAQTLRIGAALLSLVLGGWSTHACGATALAGPQCRAATGFRYASAEQAFERLLALTQARLDLMETVAAWKWWQGVAVIDREREAVVIDDAVAYAEQLGFTPGPVRRWFELQIGWAQELQTRWHEQWRIDGAPRQPAPDLADSIRPQLDRIGHELLLAAYRARPELESPLLYSRYRARTLQALHRLQEPAAADELLAILASIRSVRVAALARIRASGILRIGTTGDYPPFSSDEHGRLEGVDVDLGSELARALGVEPYFVPTSWPQLIADLQASHFDVALSGITVTPQRARVGSFSLAYFRGGKAAIVRCGEEGALDTLAEIDSPEVRVVVNPGGTNEAFARSQLARAQLLIHPDNRTIFEEILRHRADVMITDDIEIELQTRRYAGLCRASSDTFTTDAKAILMQQDEPLIEQVNAWLSSAMRSGLIDARFPCHLTAL